MTPVRGTGGYLTVFVDGDTPLVAASARRLDVTDWSLDRMSRGEDVSNASADETRVAHVIGHNSWSVSLLLNDDKYPDASGLRRGDVVQVWFKVGSGGAAQRYHFLNSTTITRVTEADDSTQDVVRLTVTGEGGDLTEWTTAAPAYL